MKTVSIPLAFSRRAISRPAWKVFSASLPMRAAYRPRLRYFRGEASTVDVGWTASLARRRRPWSRSRSSRPSTGPRQPWIPCGGSPKAGRSPRCASWWSLVLLRYLTGWGRQYWRITGGYFTGRHAVPVWLMLAVLLLLVLLSVRLTVLLSYQSNDMFSSLQTAFEGAATGNEQIKHSGIHGFWMSLVALQRAGVAVHRPASGRHLPDAAVHHRLAHVADRPPHRRLAATDGPTTGTCSSTTPSTTPTSVSSRTSTSSPPVPAAPRTSRPTRPRTRCCSVRCARWFRWCRSPRSLWHLSGRLDVFGFQLPPRDVLDRRGLCADRDGRRVPARASADLAQLQQREAQRRVPLCAGPAARRGRGGRLLPG